MTEHNATRWDQRLFTLLWTWMAFRTLLPWLVTHRISLEGDSYRWGTEYFGHMFHSAGFERPDFLIIYGLLAASLFVMWQLRRHHLRVAAAAMLVYLGFFAADAAQQFLSGEPMMFHGDTLGIHVDLSVPFFILQFGMFAVAIAWWWLLRDIRVEPAPRPVAGFRRLLVMVCIAAFPVQIALLVTGEPHGTTDAIGVIMTLSQWALLAYALYPGAQYGRPKRVAMAVA